jgi:hypothetical protein
MPDQKKTTCAMNRCECPVKPGQRYCSSICEQQVATSEPHCDCGHDVCLQAIAEAALPA